MKQVRPVSRSSGFTLVELMITVVIVAVLLSVVVPGVENIQNRNRMDTAAHALFTSLMFTRSEAIKRNSPVVMCKSSDASSCTDAAEWHHGWLIYADADSDSVVDPNEVLRIGTAFENGDTLYTSGADFDDQVVYNVDGSASGTGDFVLCNKGEASEFAREISISFTGRPKMNSGTVDCTP